MMSEPFTTARLGTPPEARFVEHALRAQLDYARHNFYEYCAVDKAHTVMLIEQKIITPAQGGRILAMLTEIEGLGPERFPMDPKFDSFLLQVERYMIERIGEDTAGRMHTGRSRIDHDAAVERLHARNRLMLVMRYLLEIQDTIVSLAATHAGTLMPGYTHLQHAQPWTFGHYLLRFSEVFDRDLARLRGAFARTNLSSLGGAALAGTSWPLNRERTAELLGHDGIVPNAHDAGCFSPDFSPENAAVLSIYVNNLGRLAGDLYVWHTWEFGFVELADGYCGTSSIMPQKKNADSLEMVRGWAGQAIGWLPWALGTLKGATSTDCDNDFVGDIMQQASEVAWRASDLLNGAISTMTVHTGRMRERTDANWTTANNLADALVRQCNLSFRTAHHVVGRLVRLAVADGIPPREVGTALLDRAARETINEPLGVPQTLITEALDPARFVESRRTKGSVHPREVAALLAAARDKLAAHRAWYAAKQTQLERAAEALRTEVARYAQ